MGYAPYRYRRSSGARATSQEKQIHPIVVNLPCLCVEMADRWRDGRFIPQKEKNRRENVKKVSKKAPENEPDNVPVDLQPDESVTGTWGYGGTGCAAVRL